MVLGEQQLKLPDGRFKIPSAVGKTAAADHHIPQVGKVPLPHVDIPPVHLRHGLGGQRQHAVNEVFQRGGHPVAVQRKAEQQHIAGQHLLQKLPHVIVNGALSAVILTGKASPAEFDLLVDHVNGSYLLRPGLLHALQKRAGDVHGIAFFSWDCR